MKNYIIAWRNIWRNKRRTLITTASVFFGVLLAALMSSMQEGSYENMIDNVVKFYSGYIQVQEEEYWENKTLYYSFETSDSLYSKINSVDEITLTVPRLESFALMSHKNTTQPARVIGIDPEKEDSMTNLSDWITKGEYFNGTGNEIILGSILSKNLDIGLKDTVALLGQGFYGSTVAELFVVRAILEFPNPELNKNFAYMKLNRAQQFYSAQGRLTSLAIMLENYTDLDPAMKHLEAKIDSPYTAMSWREMQPEMVQMIESDRAGGIIMKAILYIIIGFGILGTVIMMIAERKREMGLMVAVGMKKHKLAAILFLETIYIGIIGVFAGILVSIPIVFYMVNNPVPLSGDAAEAMVDMGIEPLLLFSSAPRVFLNQFITVLILTAAVSLYPVINALGMKSIKYLRA
jgi:ABC-type lipoprotein release transport system permease subunit